MILQAVVLHLLVYKSWRGERVVPVLFSQPLQSPPVPGSAVAKPGSDVARQDALHSSIVEGSEGPKGDSELPRLPEVV